MAASNNIRSSQEEKSQIKQIASAPTHNLTLGFAMTVKDWLCSVSNSFPLGRLGWAFGLLHIPSILPSYFKQSIGNLP